MTDREKNRPVMLTESFFSNLLRELEARVLALEQRQEAWEQRLHALEQSRQAPVERDDPR